VVQTTTVNSQLPITHKCALHALVAAYLNVVVQLMSIPSLSDHVRSVRYVSKPSQQFYSLLDLMMMGTENFLTTRNFDVQINTKKIFSVLVAIVYFCTDSAVDKIN